MAKNLRMALCCQNQEYRGTSQRYGPHRSASIFGHNAHVTELSLLKKKKKKKKKNQYKTVLLPFSGWLPETL